MEWTAAWEQISPNAFAVPALPDGLWTPVLDFLPGPCILKIAAVTTDSWSYSPTAQCGADGDMSSLLLPARCLYENGPVGAMIAKVGGSSAGFKDDGTVFLIGKTAIINVEAPGGPLYLTINDEVTGMWNNAGSIRVLIWRAGAPPQGPVPDGSPPYFSPPRSSPPNSPPQ
jgi:hypothetical protein